MALLKFSHVFFIIIWLGALITLSGFLAYQKENNRELIRLFKRLYFKIELPAMILAILLGVLLIFLKDVSWKAPWLHLKLTFAAALILCDVFLGCIVSRLDSRNYKIAGIGKHFLHYAATACLIMVLVAIYILK